MSIDLATHRRAYRRSVTSSIAYRPGHGEWSANDVLAHVRACADMWGNCIEVIIAQDTPTIRAVNPRTWIKKTDYLEQKFQPSLRSVQIYWQYWKRCRPKASHVPLQ